MFLLTADTKRGDDRVNLAILPDPRSLISLVIKLMSEYSSDFKIHGSRITYMRKVFVPPSRQSPLFNKHVVIFPSRFDGNVVNHIRDVYQSLVAEAARGRKFGGLDYYCRGFTQALAASCPCGNTTCGWNRAKNLKQVCPFLIVCV